MESDYYKKEITRSLEKLSYDYVAFFGWLCAIRALPFLGASGTFDFWGDSGDSYNKQQKFLLSVFRAIDSARAAVQTSSYRLTAAKVAFRAASSAASASADASAATAYYAAYVASAASSAASSAAAAADATFYSTATTSSSGSGYSDSIASAAAAFSAASNAAYYSTVVTPLSSYPINLEPILLNDLMLLSDKYRGFRDFNNDTQIYGGIWGNFQIALHSSGCDYWGKWYTNLFAKKFMIDDNDDINMRLQVPPEISDKGAAAVAEHIRRAYKQGGIVTDQRETRLIILGSAGSGKTTLARRLVGDMTFPDPEDTTHGVDTDKEFDCDGITAHIWDFGGQAIYHASHRCFITANCIYVLVINSRTEGERDYERINYWLETINIYSGREVKVFIVFNESDNRKQYEEDYDSFKDGTHGHLVQEIYGFNIGKDMKSLNVFKNDVINYIGATGYHSIGKNDSEAMKELKVLFNGGKKVLTVNELETVLEGTGIKSKKDKAKTKELLNTLGVALSYEIMEDYVIDPDWITHGVYTVVDYMKKNNYLSINYGELDKVFKMNARTTQRVKESIFWT